MARGRPVFSEIRQNVIEILAYMGKAYGYDIYKVYIEIFPKITLSSIYYHLRKGTSLEEFRIDKVVQEQGDYSWGSSTEKIYYSLGKNANPKGNKRVKEYLDSRKK